MGYKNGFKTIYTPISENRKEILVYMDARKISLYDKERSEYIKFYQEEGLTGLAFENEVYYPFEGLEVLKQYPFIEHLFIGQKNIKDLKGIQYIDCLKGLYFEGNTAAFDFEQVKDSLEILSLSWHRKLSNLDALQHLKFLHIEKDNEEVVLPSNIKVLELWKSKRTNLDFCQNLPSLKQLELFSNSKLTDLEGLVHLSQSLERLEIEKCKNIADYAPILKLEKLKRLRIDTYNKERKEELRELQSLLRKDIEVIIYPKLK